jgi:hypothetical protein
MEISAAETPGLRALSARDTIIFKTVGDGNFLKKNVPLNDTCQPDGARL